MHFLFMIRWFLITILLPIITTTCIHFVWMLPLEMITALDISKQSSLVLTRRQALIVPPTTTLLTTTLFPSSSSSSTTTTTSSSTNIPSAIALSDQTTKLFPVCSFGLQIYNDETAYHVTKMALEVGYRNFFASVLAKNQKGFAKAIQESNLSRDELYICGSVVSNRVQGYDAAYQLTTKGWKQNQIDLIQKGHLQYLDQIMLDYPGPDTVSIQGQWKALEEMHQLGYVKSLSVSNFSPKQLDSVLQKANIRPVVNQLPFSVAYHPNSSILIQENKQRDIVVQAWAPLGKSLGGRFTQQMKDTCTQIGRKYTNPPKTWAQVALRWILQKGVTFTTQSENQLHLQQNLDLFDFTLSDDDMLLLDSLA